jgi:release factor glutamine methyltransferase
MQSIRKALHQAEVYLTRFGIQDPRRDAELLMEHLLGLGRTGIYLELHQPLSKRDAFWSLVERRSKREPIGYITNVQAFWSLDLRVDPVVFIPRRETEHLVEEALKLILATKAPRILDVGTGSGAIALALAKEKTDSRVWATDVSEKAIRRARCNARECGLAGRVEFFCGDLLRPLSESRARFDLIVCNPPYVGAFEWEELQDEVKLWEPSLALLGGEDGTRFYPELLRGGLHFLDSDGSLLLEVGAKQGEGIAKMAKEMGGYTEVLLRKDYGGQDRVLVVRRGKDCG